MTTTPNAINAIAAVFAGIEKNQRKAIKQVRQLRDDYQALHDNGSTGALLTMASFAQLEALVVSQYAETLYLHLTQYREADALGIDPGALPPEEDDGISILSGGGR